MHDLIIKKKKHSYQQLKLKPMLTLCVQPYEIKH